MAFNDSNMALIMRSYDSSTNLRTSPSSSLAPDSGSMFSTVAEKVGKTCMKRITPLRLLIFTFVSSMDRIWLPEDKEALNYHILLIENMNHYIECVDDRGDAILTEGKRKAQEEYDEHLNLYVDAVIRRPLGKIMVSTDNSTTIFYMI